ncbi:MAG: cytochrome c oxidase accessory protein CcoG [Ignavibacteria bacterium]|jgi:cytochrome c oxidase accessory protein FixG|nr:cytochrome c oxidase accessory protein CcoG [Ignavibacteria bacterium]MCU7503580.1 cytochrome c oxidase accessory protein CcoG [Ignavibacteria bacterium]MCU7516766.1 cytochrome c oxidase accessory protein CcoG [Ignavibacteria bacterium]
MTSQAPSDSSQEFRDSLGIVSKEGKRNWIYPKKPKGKFYRARTALSILLLLFFFAAPFLIHNGNPVFLFNIFDRKFIILGIVLGPHDFFILLLAMISLAVFAFLFTTIFGRVFCGWVCPQTIFMEMVYRKIEYLIEGDASKQRALKKAPWNLEKVLKKGSKQIIFWGISFLVANTFLMWIIGPGELFKIVVAPPEEHLAELASITVFSFVFYGVFAWFREQACILVCPYGRLQGVLLDENSLVVAYDFTRGEPRGKLRKLRGVRNLGDCVDCRMCVDVCPTGIDIRNGTQLECVNCAACIDACNAVMEKTGRSKGLIRYASLKGIRDKSKFKFSPRAFSYSAVILLLTGIITYMLLTRTDFEVNILRTPGLLSQQQPEGKISNLYDVKITNKTFSDATILLRLKDPDGEIKVIGEDKMTSRKQAITEGKVLVILNEKNLKGIITPVKIAVYAEGKEVDEISTSFLGRVE